jgi:hypothetical protein
MNRNVSTRTIPRRTYLMTSRIGRIAIPQKIRITGHNFQNENQEKWRTPKFLRMNNRPIAIRIMAQKRCLYFMCSVFDINNHMEYPQGSFPVQINGMGVDISWLPGLHGINTFSVSRKRC